jgi:hypothetical protein
MPQVEFELTISAGERPHTYALDRAPTGTGDLYCYGGQILEEIFYKSLERHTREKHRFSSVEELKNSEMRQLTLRYIGRLSEIWH